MSKRKAKSGKHKKQLLKGKRRERVKVKHRFLGPPSRGFPKFDLDAYIAWNRRQETASLDEVELKTEKENVGELELEWFDFSIRPKEKSARRKKIESLLNKVGL